jgi:hypothetical protein
MQLQRFVLASAAALATFATLGLGTSADATVINLQAAGVTGTGCCFASAGNAQTVSVTAGGDTVVLNGGTPLGPDIASLPASDSIAYGTSDTYTVGETGYTNPLTLQFFAAGTTTPQNVNNFFLNLYNGNTVSVDYTVQDNLGDSVTFLIPPNFSSGRQAFGFPSAGNSFTITAGPAVGGCCGYDFFIDDIGFNQALPGVPEPATWTMMLIGFAGIGSVVRRRATRSAVAAA